MAALALTGVMLAPANPVLLYLSHGDPRVGTQLATSSRAGRVPLNISQPESAGALTGAIRPDGRLIAFISGTTLWTAPLERRSIATGIGRSSGALRASVVRQDDGTWRGAVRVAIAAHGPLSWSPDGRTLLFNRPPGSTGGSGTIIKLSVSPGGASTSEQRLFTGPDSNRDTWARFSPDGTKILFTRFVNTKGDRLMTVNTDGRALTELPADNGLWNYGSWSPDGTKIAAVRTYTALTPGTPGIYTMDANGERVSMIEGTTSGDISPFFSPDGSEIIFSRSLRSRSIDQRDLYKAHFGRSGEPRALFATPGMTEVPLQWINFSS